MIARFAPVLVVVLGCDRGAPPTAPPAGTAYQVEAAPPRTACVANEPCVVEIAVRALAPFHLNRDYPFKFVPTETPGVLYREPASAFEIRDDRTGRQAVEFRARPGRTRIAGTMKLSVCTDEQCRIEDAPVAIDVTVR